jgi:hypothetical protein
MADIQEVNAGGIQAIRQLDAEGFVLETTDGKVYRISLPPGVVGPVGPKGDPGPRGNTGEMGSPGADGLDGRDGLSGNDGRDGVSVTFAQVLKDGSLALMLSTGDVINAGKVIGPQGTQGLPGRAGVPGPAGEDGRTIHSFSGPPNGAIGLEGDYAIDHSNWRIYGPKSGVGWGGGQDLLAGRTNPNAQRLFGGGAVGPGPGAVGSELAQQGPMKLTELRDVNQHAAPTLGEIPTWSYTAGHPDQGAFFFKTPNAHVKNWDSVTHFEAGTVVYYHNQLWRATRDTSNVEPKVEDGRTQLYIHVAGEPTFGILPTDITSTAPPSGLQPMQFKLGYWLQYTNDQTMVVWKWVLKGADPSTHKPIGEWEGRPWTVMVWRSHTPPSAAFPPNTVVAWINTNPGSTAQPVKGQQDWASLELATYLGQAADVSAPTPTHGDLLVYDETIHKWKAVHRNVLINPAQNEAHPLRRVTENPITITDTDYSILLDLPTGTAPVITLPNAVGCKGRELHFKNYHGAGAISSSNNVRNSKNYDLVTNTITAAVNGAWSMLVSDGIYWLKLQSYPTTDT